MYMHGRYSTLLAIEIYTGYYETYRVNKRALNTYRVMDVEYIQGTTLYIFKIHITYRLIHCSRLVPQSPML